MKEISVYQLKCISKDMEKKIAICTLFDVISPTIDNFF